MAFMLSCLDLDNEAIRALEGLRTVEACDVSWMLCLFGVRNFNSHD